MIGVSPVRADMIDTSGMKAWEHCALCHGLDGNSRMAKFPKLAAQRYDYLIKQLKDFKTQHRLNDGGPMTGMTEQLSDKDLEASARYFSALPPPAPARHEPPPGPAQNLGRRIFEHGLPGKKVPACIGCHGARVPDRRSYPRLEAQHAAYIAKQLDDFRDAERNNDPDGIMRRIAAALSEQEIEAVAAYAAGLARPERAGQ